MAPEIVLGSSPSVKSDSFSLAVVLFMLFVMSHPFEGKKTCVPCMTEELEKKFFGKEPVFIYDPDDKSNSPEPGIHCNAIKRWKLYPLYLREKFQKAFSKQALSDPSHRVLEIDWLRLFIRLRSEIFKCACGEIFFADPLQETSCPACSRKNKFSMYIKTERYNVPVHQRTKLFNCHTEAESNDFVTATAEVNQKNDDFEIKNISNKVWTVSGNGRQSTIAPNAAMILRKGIAIDFGGFGGSTAQIL